MVLGVVNVNLPSRVRQRRPPMESVQDPIPALRPPYAATSAAGTKAVHKSPPHPTDRQAGQPPAISPAKAIGMHTLRRFQAAHQPTPNKLRELEEGWRERRRISLSPEGPTRAGSPLKPTAATSRRKSIEPRLAQTSAPTRRTVSFADQPIPPLLPRPEAKVTAAQSSSTPTTQSHIPAMSGQGLDLRVRSSTVPATDAASQPRPILAHPLPSSPSPRHITSKSSETIHVPPDEAGRKYELVLRLDRRVILVHIGGDLLTIRPSTTPATRKTRDRTLRLDQAASWTQKEQNEWEAVERLVERTKRHTPRIKIYAAQGNICVTCSSPPDIVLAFPIPSSASGMGSTTKTSAKVRITYSRLASEMRIDTSTWTVAAPPHGERGESFRTRRIVPLKSNLPLNGTVYMGGKELKEEESGLRDALRALGITSADEWRSEEKEAVRRLWLSQKDWIGFS